MKKKTALSLLVSAMLLMTGNAYADDPYTYTYTTDDGETSYTIYFLVEDGGAVITNKAGGTTSGLMSYSTSSIVIPETVKKDDTEYRVTSIDTYAFFYCISVTSVDLSACTSLTSIDDYAFSMSSAITTVKLPASVKSIGASAFNSCTAMTSINLGDCTNLTTLGTAAFSGCKSMASIDLPTALTEIPESLLYNCTTLTSVVIPDNVTSIGKYAFYSCTGLTSIDIPSGVTSIGEDVFYSCSSLEKVKIYASTVPTTIGENVFGATKKDDSDALVIKVYVPPYSLASYESGWSTYSGHFRPFVDRAVSSAGAATLALPFQATIPDGITAYTLSITSGHSATATAVSGTTLTKDTPVYISGSEATYEFLGTSTAAVTSQYVTDDDGNATSEAYNPTAYALVGVYADSYQYAPVGSYVLQNQDGTTAFYRVYDEDKVKVGQFKAYLVRESESDDDETENSSLSIIFADESETTGIERVDTTTDSPATGAIYNLQGVRMGDSTECLPKGIYIRGGKKFVVK